MWIKLSGASPELLKKTNEFYEKEAIKYSRLGKLVVVPALLGSIGGFYAVSTVVDSLAVSFLFGLLWFFIILAIDMALSATMYKTSKDDGLSFWTVVFFRIIFSLCVGLVISHPLVLRIFEPSINQNIIDRDADFKKNNIQLAKESLNNSRLPFLSEISLLERENTCLSNLISFETSKDNTFAKSFSFEGVSCGNSSGLGAGCSTECTVRKNRIKDNKKSIERIRKDMLQSTETEKRILDTATSRKDIEPPKDYLERTEALSSLMSSNDHVALAAKLLIAFFVFLDVLIVLFKATTPMGAYEYTTEAYLKRHLGILESENKMMIQAALEVEEINQMNRTKSLVLMEARNLYTTMIEKLDDDFHHFEDLEKSWLKKASFLEFKKRKQIKDELFHIREMYIKSRATTIFALSAELAKIRNRSMKEEESFSKETPDEEET